jgi:hypothetical protein
MQVRSALRIVLAITCGRPSLAYTNLPLREETVPHASATAARAVEEQVFKTLPQDLTGMICWDMIGILRASG